MHQGQKTAITYGEGPLWITAGPGSGKTEVLISRALKLLLVDDVPPESIPITTFTEKAAQNLEERIADWLATIGFEDAVDANALRIGTLHSLCNDLMQEYRYPEYVSNPHGRPATGSISRQPRHLPRERAPNATSGGTVQHDLSIVTASTIHP